MREDEAVKLARLEDTEKQAALAKKDEQQQPAQRGTGRKTLGLELSNLNDEVRRRFGIKPNVKGVVITSVDANSSAAEKRLVPGTVVVSVQQQPVNTAAELQDRIE